MGGSARDTALAAGLAAGAGLGLAFTSSRGLRAGPLRELPTIRWPCRSGWPPGPRGCELGLPVGLWAAACWAGSLLVGLAALEPRGAMIADGAGAILALLAAVLSLRFDAATARLLSFEPTSFFRHAADVLGGRLLAVSSSPWFPSRRVLRAQRWAPASGHWNSCTAFAAPSPPAHDLGVQPGGAATEAGSSGGGLPTRPFVVE